MRKRVENSQQFMSKTIAINKDLFYRCTKLEARGTYRSIGQVRALDIFIVVFIVYSSI